jgi:hypothetical protein
MTKLIKPEERVSLIHSKINKTPVNKDSIEAMTRETDKSVVGTFLNVEYPGQPGKVCGLYYKGMPYFCKTFEDSERCTIPLSIARCINERSHSEQHSYLQDEKGNPLKTSRKNPRYKFMVEMVA